VAALVPRAEIEGEMGDSHVGLQARLMSQALRKMTGALNNSGTTAIFINQLREKIGVMFGCFSYGTRVQLADGTTEKIGKIVNQKMDVEVMSYDPRRDQIVPRKVVNWFNNGPAERFLQFTVEKSGGNGKSQFAATPNHLIRTPAGWTEAGDLIAGDRVLAAEPHLLSDQQFQVVLGSLMGDGNLSPNRRPQRCPVPHGHGAKAGRLPGLEDRAAGQHQALGPRERQGCPVRRLHPAARTRELRVYLGDGKKFLSEDYLKALTRWHWPSGTWTTVRSPCAPRACSSAPRRQRPHRDLCRSHDRGVTRPAARLPARHPRPGCAAALRRNGGQGSAGVLHRGVGQVPGSWWRRTWRRRWSTSCCHGSVGGHGGAGVRRARAAAGAGPGARCSRQAALGR
jgi:hypothetical protein